MQLIPPSVFFKRPWQEQTRQLEPAPDHYTVLFNRLLEGKLSPGELEDLMQWLGQDDIHPAAAELIGRQLKQPVSFHDLDPAIITSLGNKLPNMLGKKKSIPKIPLFAKAWLRYAAVFIVISSLAALYFWHPGDTENTPVVKVTPPPVNNDISPGMAGAILTLADGRTILLDSVGNGLIATQNGSKILLHNSELKFDDSGSATSAVAYNTIATPYGRQFQTTLSDGTRVWLNAGSSLRFPTVFTGGERRVEISGEGYFEVTRNPAMPFRVNVNNKTEIEVLGTDFNINAYDNEASINTTLLHGSVKVKTLVGTSPSAITILPGQQAQVTAGKCNISNHIDLGKVMAWKNGVFNFNDATLEEVMRQLERWYNIEVVYEKGVPDLEFVGKMGRDLSLLKVLRGLEMAEVHFRLEGRRLIVMP